MVLLGVIITWTRVGLGSRIKVGHRLLICGHVEAGKEDLCAIFIAKDVLWIEGTVGNAPSMASFHGVEDLEEDLPNEVIVLPE